MREWYVSPATLVILANESQNNVRRGSYYDEGSDDSNGGGGASRARRSKVNITVRRRSDASDEEMT